jgi:hypothetical protein
MNSPEAIFGSRVIQYVFVSALEKSGMKILLAAGEKNICV